MTIFIMLNNLLHDFAVSILFACLAVLAVIYRMSRRSAQSNRADFQNRTEFAREIFAALNKIILGAWVVIIVGGVIRTMAYEEYEWMVAAGRGQVAALIVKHVLLGGLVVAGTILQLRLRKVLRRVTSP